MAVKKTRRVRRGGNNSGESESEAQLAPPEERAGAGSSKAAANDGTLNINTSELKLPQDLIEEKKEMTGFLSIDPIVLAILCFSLIFILAIGYVIWSGWEPPPGQ
jgi:hypothetical protein